MLELSGENPFKIRAYQSGARALETLEEDLSTIIEEDRLGKIKGIGSALTKKIITLYKTGELEFYDQLKASVPPGLLEMLEIPGLGGKKIKVIHARLGVNSIEELKRVCETGEIAKLPGFGAKSQEKILTGIANREIYGRRHLGWAAHEVAQPILEKLRSLSDVSLAEAAGSLRRGRETVGDLDFIVGSSNPAPIMQWFTGQEGIKEVTAHGETKSSIRLESGLQADIRVVPVEQFHFALHHFTGSKDHNVKMRQRALSRGYSLSEWGITPKDENNGNRIEAVKCQSEQELFHFLGLEFIPPELREGLDELEEAEAGKIPELVKASDIRGVFHNHTSATDGRHTLEEMVGAAQSFGWEYYGLGDHSKASFQANGMDEARVASQIESVKALNASGKFNIHVFSGIECDILPDGSLDLDDSILKELDFVVVSVHSSFSQSEEDMTQRIIRAIEHPHSTMLGHLTGRLLLRREGYQVNVPKVIDAALANGKIIEINAHPVRLDMDWRHWKKAAQRGLITSINPDAHEMEGLEYYRAGVQTARKGWLTKEHVFNTWPLGKVKAWLLEKGS